MSLDGTEVRFGDEVEDPKRIDDHVDGRDGHNAGQKYDRESGKPQTMAQRAAPQNLK